MTSVSTRLDAGSRTGALEADGDEPVYFGLPLTAWLKAAVISLLMGMVFWPNLQRLWNKTNPFYGEPNWGHAIVIPFVGLYYLYINRETLLAAPVRTAWAGLAILLAGILIFVYGIWPGQNDYIKDIGMVTALFGTVTLLCGWRVMRIAWFPIVFLLCALPWPGLVYSKIAQPLQHLAAQVAVRVLTLTGVDAAVSGTKILMEGTNGVRTLNVAEACAGLRSLMTFISVAAAVAFLTARPLWQRLFLVASAVPIAIFCNVMRVAGQGLLDHYVSPSLSEGFAHQFVGLIMLIPAFFLILLTAWMLDHLFVEDVIDKSKLKARAATATIAGTTAARPAATEPRSAVGAAPVATGTRTGAAAPRAQSLPPRPAGSTGGAPRRNTTTPPPPSGAAPRKPEDRS